MIDKKYCMSSFLMFRTIADWDKSFCEELSPNWFIDKEEKDQIHNSFELEESLKKQIREMTKDRKAVLALSGGIDSAILAKFMPEGSKAYTFRCCVPGIEVIDESARAAQYARECGLEHEIIDIYWEDMEKLSPELMRHKGAPIHSIEVQIYKAALRAKAEGYNKLIFGESADLNYGGLDGLMSKEWTFGEFVNRYSYILPYMILKDSELILEPYKEWCSKDGYIDVHNFNRNFFRREALNSYWNACSCAGDSEKKIECVMPYNNTWLEVPLDYERIRKGENKYLIREIFSRLYTNQEIPVKTPMPRPMEEWLVDWVGPKRKEFIPNCTRNLSGDQKWLVYALEIFLNMIDEMK